MKLQERFLNVAKRRRLAANTIDCYWRWIAEFLRFCKRGEVWVPPQKLGAREVEAFLTSLVRERRVAASTQNQACNAIVFLYRRVLDELPKDHLGKFTAERSKRSARVPTVLSENEVLRVIEAMAEGSGGSGHQLMARLLYGQVQTLLGHARLETTMVYTHVTNNPAIAVVSPLDRVMVG